MRGRTDKVSSVRAVRERPSATCCGSARREKRRKGVPLFPLTSAAAAETLPSGTANPVMYDRPQWWPETSRPPSHTREKADGLAGRRAGIGNTIPFHPIPSWGWDDGCAANFPVENMGDSDGASKCSSPALPFQTGHVEPYINKEFHLGDGLHFAQ